MVLSVFQLYRHNPIGQPVVVAHVGQCPSPQKYHGTHRGLYALAYCSSLEDVILRENTIALGPALGSQCSKQRQVVWGTELVAVDYYSVRSTKRSRAGEDWLLTYRIRLDH